MNAELRAAVESKQFQDATVPNEVEPVPYTLSEFVSFITRERERLGRLAENAHMTAE